MVRKDKVFSSVNKGGIILMLCLLLQYSRESTLPWKLFVLQRPAKMSLEHRFLSLELGIKFTSGVHKHWFLQRFIRDISLVLYAWIRSENSVYYAFCIALWLGLKSLCWPRVGTLVLQWLRFVSLLQGPGSAWQRPSWAGRAPAGQGQAMSVMCSSPAPGHLHLRLLWCSGPSGKCKCCSFVSVLVENRLKNYI